MKLIHLLLVVFLLQLPLYQSSRHDYSDALTKSILFFEGQRSGVLPKDQRLTWRGNSGLTDGATAKTDLKGGYYDAGDNLKFHFPMAFTTTMLAWSVIEFGSSMPAGEERNALAAVRWGTDYLLKTVSQLPNRIFVQVGDPEPDHDCWERPEDMDTPRTVYTVEAPNPASDVAGETAAALAASSIAFRSSDPGYSQTLLRNAVKAFEYADAHRGAYSDNSDIKSKVCPYYCDFGGYQDELLWSAAWLRKATQEQKYLSYIQNNAQSFGAGNNVGEFGWEDKHAGLNVLLSKEVFGGNKNLQSFKNRADSFVCLVVPDSTNPHIEFSPGGLIYKPGGSNLQHATAITFLLLTYADYLERSKQTVACAGATADPSTLRRVAKSQVDYILGDNPKKLSYMVGYGKNYPQKIHHRGSSLPSIKTHPQVIRCSDGSTYFNSTGPNPNVLTGAVVGGPTKDDAYDDSRADFVKTEPTTYINAPFVGTLAYFAANPRS